MNNAEMAAAAWAKDYDGAKARLWLRPSHITAFLAGAAWQREQDLSILRSTKADQFLSTYSMSIAADYLETATKQSNLPDGATEAESIQSAGVKPRGTVPVGEKPTPPEHTNQVPTDG